ncbi:proto-oncogene serine/threonine-protein kinase Pim-2 [Microdochium nivale]|nr:proto-oncogene serine/threonine-protein kinase Pim-2 [Microdochium nivale]
MKQFHAGEADQQQDHGADVSQDEEPPRGRGRNKQLAPNIYIPKNKSTGNLAAVSEDEPLISRARHSIDAGAALLDFDSVRSPVITEHDHGLGPSGLRRIRQQAPLRPPTVPSTAASSRSPSLSISRSASLSAMLSYASQMPTSPGPTSPTFGEDLTRFPSESLHSFSFAHQSEDFMHNRQNVLKRSIEFMKDRMGWLVSSNAAMASAQARVTGDYETQNMLDLLARAQLVGAGNLPHLDATLAPGPLTGPAMVSRENPFESQFSPRSDSPDHYETEPDSPTNTKTPRASTRHQRDEPPEDDSFSVPKKRELEDSSKTPTDESGATAQAPTTAALRPNMRRTTTDVRAASIQRKLVDTMTQPFQSGMSHGSFAESLTSPTLGSQSMASSFSIPGSHGPSAVHGHSARWTPAAQAIFTTQAKPPWTIMAANDLACLVFGVTNAEVRKMGILEVVQEERRDWLEKKLVRTGSEDEKKAKTPARRPQTVHSGNPEPPKLRDRSRSRGVLLCGDVVPIQKRNGATGSASLWVKEKRGGLIWVVEEIHEHAAHVKIDDDGFVTEVTGETGYIWGEDNMRPGMDVGKLIPRIPRQGIDPKTGALDYAQIAKRRYYTCRSKGRVNIPVTLTQTRGKPELRVSSFPHIAGIIVVDPHDHKIKSSNAAFSEALFGYEKPEGQTIESLLPDFADILRLLTEHDGVDFEDGLVIPEHNFRKASALVALQQGRPDAASAILNPDGLIARHRDGSDLKVDVQMRVVKSEKQPSTTSGERTASVANSNDEAVSEAELVYALWITYSRHIHAARSEFLPGSPHMSGTATPLHQPSPGQTAVTTPQDMSSDTDESKQELHSSTATVLKQQLKDVAQSAAAKLTGAQKASHEAQDGKKATEASTPATPASKKKTINDFVILEDMGQGAYGQVKLARYKQDGGKKVVLKYVTKRRILVDTWTRDRRLGTIPLEIHVLDYLRRDGFRHPNIVDMEDFFEDETNYYIEMAPHGLPGMDLFDYIELRANMNEDECRSIFVQVAKAIHHLHIKVKVVHRDIKDENVILDGEGHIKLIDFGSAAYIKSGPFDVFVGTIDYAAPEVLAGNPYSGKEQDVWALGILLYTIIYKENPFYSIDEIMDRDLRVPYVVSEESINLIRCMLNRDVKERYDIEQVLQHPWCHIDT